MKSKGVFIGILLFTIYAFYSNTFAYDFLNQDSTNVIAYAITEPNGNAQIYTINSDGSGKTQLTNKPGRLYGPAYSPDATKIAFYNHLNDQTWSLYMMNAEGTNIQRLTNASDTLD
ncbi:MAG: hypothetical protein WBH40_15135 [Ignavibacteriaceae bacterium]